MAYAVGSRRGTGVWRPLNNRALCPIEVIWKNTRGVQHELLKPRSRTTVDEAVWESTMQESDGGLPRADDLTA
eukprot:12112692-Karenia_brevis.AAC.1